MASLAALRIDESIGRPAADESGLPADRLIALSSLSWPLASAGLPLAVLLPAIYAQHYGISLAALGGLFLLSRFWDAANDPLIGILSDRTRSRWGRRKPWIAAGAPVFGLSAFLLFFPQGPVTPLSRGVVLFFFYLGWTMIQIPFSAWTGELSRAYHERTRIQTFLHVSTATTLFVALLIPTFLDQVRPDDAQLKLAAMGVLVLGSLLVSVPLALRAFPEPELPDTPAERPGLAATVRAAAADGLLLRVLASDFAVTLGQTIRASLIVFYISFYMGRPDWGAGLYLLQFSFGIFAGPLWLKLGRRLGKHRTAVAGEVVQIAINLALLLVTPDAFGLLLALTVAQGLAQGSGNLMLRAMVADVADRQRLLTGRNVTGLYFSVFSLASKSATAVAVGIALPLVGWLGFDPKGANSPEALAALALVFALGPALAHALSALLILRFPLGEEAHAAIQAALATRDQTTTPAQPL